LALALALIGVGGTGALLNHTTFAGPHYPHWAAYALVLTAAAGLLVRRRWPLVALGVATVTTSVYVVLSYPYGPILLTFTVAVYLVARNLPRRTAGVASGVALVFLLAHILLARGTSPGLIGIVPASAWVVVPFATGVTVRLVRENAARAQAELIRRQADQQRLQVAQEVHDVVGHGLAAINMQAEIALHLLAKRPEQAVTALTAISRTSREALDELRATLTVLRLGDLAEVRGPTPGLARIDALVARMTDTGVPVRVEVSGSPQRLPTAVDLAAYRIIQESLTNVLRHARGATATVLLDYQPRLLALEVADTGQGMAVAEPIGHGIAGMRERVTALGGSFETRSAPGGGFLVRASLPLPAEDQT
jgi:signal transduction histidine kinase